MRRSTKKKILPLAFALVLAMIGAALAVPVITVNVQDIGAGEQSVLSPANNANVTWDLAANPDYVEGGYVSLDNTLNAGSIVYLKVYNSAGTLIAIGNYTVNTTISAGTPIPIAFNSSVNVQDMYNVAVVAVGPKP